MAIYPDWVLFPRVPSRPCHPVSRDRDSFCQLIEDCGVRIWVIDNDLGEKDGLKIIKKRTLDQKIY